MKWTGLLVHYCLICCVCMCVCVCVCVWVWVRERERERERECVCVCQAVDVSVHWCMCTFADKNISWCLCIFYPFPPTPFMFFLFVFFSCKALRACKERGCKNIIFIVIIIIIMLFIIIIKWTGGTMVRAEKNLIYPPKTLESERWHFGPLERKWTHDWHDW